MTNKQQIIDKYVHFYSGVYLGKNVISTVLKEFLKEIESIKEDKPKGGWTDDTTVVSPTKTTKHLDTLVVPEKIELPYGYSVDSFVYKVWQKQCEIIDYLISLKKEK